MTREEILKQVKTRLKAKYGDRLCGIILYGSEARGDAEPDSDIDLLVLLKGPVNYGRLRPRNTKPWNALFTETHTLKESRYEGIHPG